MAIPIIDEVLKNTLGEAVKGLVQKFLPPSASEKEKLDFQLEMEKLLQQQEQNFRDSVNAYENPAGQSKWLLNFKGIIRPGVTVIAMFLLVYIIVFGGNINWDNVTKIPAQVWGIFMIIFFFWFGGRAVSDLKNGKNS